MQRRAQVLAALSTLAAILSGCSNQSSVSTAGPNSAPSLAPGPALSGEQWNLTTTLKSITGPKNCNSVMNAEIGETFFWQLAIDRSGESVRLIASLVGEAGSDEYLGTEVDGVLTAAIKSRHGKTVCGGVMVDVLSEARLSARLSGEGHTLTGEELRTYTFTSGQTSIASYGWNAARQ
jgi:hypothetical protein